MVALEVAFVHCIDGVCFDDILLPLEHAALVLGWHRWTY